MSEGTQHIEEESSCFKLQKFVIQADNLYFIFYD